MALLAQFLVAFGAACGRGARSPSKPAATTPRSSESSSARTRVVQGLLLGSHRSLLVATDEAFVDGGLVAGLSSGEGLIAQVRDATDEHDNEALGDKRECAIKVRPEIGVLGGARSRSCVHEQGAVHSRRGRLEDRTRGPVSETETSHPARLPYCAARSGRRRSLIQKGIGHARWSSIGSMVNGTGRARRSSAAPLGAVVAAAVIAGVIFAGVGIHELNYASDHPHAYGPAKVIALAAAAGGLLAVAVAGLAFALLRRTP